MRGCAILVLLAACSGGARAVPDDLDDDLTPHADVVRTEYTLWWSGARIGDAETEVTRGRGAVRVVHREHVVVSRGGALAATRLTVDVRAGADLRATEVDADAEGGGADGRATRAPDGSWRIEVAGEAARTAPGDAVPDDLVPLWWARDGKFDGEVLMAGRGFAIARLAIDADGVARLSLPDGEATSRLQIDRDGTVARAAGADGVVLVRATSEDVNAHFDPPEVVDSSALPVNGTVDADASVVEFTLAPVSASPPPSLPGQTITVSGDRWGVRLDASLAGGPAAGPAGADRSEEIATLAHDVSVRIADDLSQRAMTMEDARHARAGDCTTHALEFAALAGDAGIEARLVTGFRLDGDRLVRHRWAIAWTGSAWIAVDPTSGDAPARANLLGLVVHGARADDLALADDAAFSGTVGARAKVHAAAKAP